MNEEKAVQVLHALAHGDRLRVLKTLVEAGPDGLSAGQIADTIGASPSRASFHLSALSDAGVVSSTRVSRSILYRADFTTMGALMRYILEDCCKGAPEVAACCVQSDGDCCG